MEKKIYTDAITAIIKSMEAYISRKLSMASFDRTVEGVVIAVDGTQMTCTVQVDGKAHKIGVPSCPFSVGEKVAVLIPCNNWRRASVLGAELKQLNKNLKQLHYDDGEIIEKITIPSYGYFQVFPPVADKTYLFATTAYWSTNTGAFSLHGADPNRYYVTGTPGVTITGLKVRYWFYD